MNEEMKRRCKRAMAETWDYVARDVLVCKDEMSEAEPLTEFEPSSTCSREEVIDIVRDKLYQHRDNEAVDAIKNLTPEDRKTLELETFKHELYGY